MIIVITTFHIAFLYQQHITNDLDLITYDQDLHTVPINQLATLC